MRETIPEYLKGYYEDAKKGLAPNESWKDSFVAELIERIAAEKARNKVLEEALRIALSGHRCESPIRRPLPNPEGYAGKFEVSNCGKCSYCQALAALREDR